MGVFVHVILYANNEPHPCCEYHRDTHRVWGRGRDFPDKGPWQGMSSEGPVEKRERVMRHQQMHIVRDQSPGSLKVASSDVV